MPRSCRRALRLRYILARGRNVLYKRAYENERRREGESKGNMRSARAKNASFVSRGELLCSAMLLPGFSPLYNGLMYACVCVYARC